MAQTLQTIGNFYDRAIAREFSRDFLFRVLSINFAGGAAFNEGELIYARTAELPSRENVNVQSKFMGLPFNIAGTVRYPGSEAYNINFYCDANSQLRNKFLAESRRVFDDATSTGDYNIAGRGSTITLAQVDKNLEPVTIFKLVGANIRNVGKIQYSMAEGTGQPVYFDTTIAYHFFEENAPL